MEEIDGIEVDLALLPEDLRPLAGLIRRYSVGDDVEREKRLEATSDDDLRELRDAPEGRWDALNAYLDEHMEKPGTPEQDLAILLSSFAEAAMEARFELESRETAD